MKSRAIAVILTLFLTSIPFNLMPAIGSSTTKLCLNPEISHALAGESFTVDVKVADVPVETPLYSWQVYMSFDSSVLECVNVTEGEFLEDQPEGTIGMHAFREDWAMFGWSTKGRHAGVSGSGTLATVEFHVLTTGESVLNITSEDTYLLESRPPPVPPGEDPFREIPFTPENGFFTNIAVPPTASFIYSPSTPGIDETITFDASASHDPDGTIVRYEWDFGDGELVNMTVAVVAHAYEVAGTYIVTLKVVDNSGLYGTSAKEITIRVAHDVAVVEVITSETIVTAGESLSIDVTVLNKGTETESFDVETYYDGNLIDTQPVWLDPGASRTLTLVWDTSGVEEGTYTISAEATEVEGETNLEDNTREDGTVRVEVPEPPEPPFPKTWAIVAVVVVVLATGILPLLVFGLLIWII